MVAKLGLSARVGLYLVERSTGDIKYSTESLMKFTIAIGVSLIIAGILAFIVDVLCQKGVNLKEIIEDKTPIIVYGSIAAAGAATLFINGLAGWAIYSAKAWLKHTNQY